MGLDMYAYALEANEIPEGKLVDVEIPDLYGEVRDACFFYWRKHPNTHGWMEALYRERGGQDGTFNGATVVLTPEDIDNFERDVNENNLPDTDGFFFGVSDRSRSKEDKMFIKLCRLHFKHGRKVVYWSSW